MRREPKTTPRSSSSRNAIIRTFQRIFKRTKSILKNAPSYSKTLNTARDSLRDGDRRFETQLQMSDNDSYSYWSNLDYHLWRCVFLHRNVIGCILVFHTVFWCFILVNMSSGFVIIRIISTFIFTVFRLILKLLSEKIASAVHDAEARYSKVHGYHA
jgi:hypothetical protein